MLDNSMIYVCTMIKVFLRMKWSDLKLRDDIFLIRQSDLSVFQFAFKFLRLLRLALLQLILKVASGRL